MPVFEFLDALIQLGLLGGVGLGTIGFVIAGIVFMIPGGDNARRGKKIAKNVFIGVVILLSAQFIIAFLVSQLGGVFC